MSIFSRKAKAAPYVPTLSNAGLEVPMYLDLNEYRERIKERMEVTMSRTDGFFKRVEEVFAAQGISAVLHNKIANKFTFEEDKFRNQVIITIGWKPRKDLTVIAKLASSGFPIPALIPDNFVSPDYDIKYHLFNHKFDLALRDGDGAFNKEIEISTQGRFNSLPDWFVNALLPLVPKS